MTAKLYVGNLSWQTTKEDLYEAFGRYGQQGPLPSLGKLSGAAPSGPAIVLTRGLLCC